MSDASPLPNHFMLIKRDGFSVAGHPLSALASAMASLEAGFWPLWERSPGREAVEPGDKVAIYAAGRGYRIVIAIATIAHIEKWTKAHERAHPLQLDDTPAIALRLAEIRVLTPARPIAERLPVLSWVRKDPVTGKPIKKWGVYLMRGAKAVSPTDFLILVEGPSAPLDSSHSVHEPAINARYCAIAPLLDPLSDGGGLSMMAQIRARAKVLRVNDRTLYKWLRRYNPLIGPSSLDGHVNHRLIKRLAELGAGPLHAASPALST